MSAEETAEVAPPVDAEAPQKPKAIRRPRKKAAPKAAPKAAKPAASVGEAAKEVLEKALAEAEGVVPALWAGGTYVRKHGNHVELVTVGGVHRPLSNRALVEIRSYNGGVEWRPAKTLLGCAYVGGGAIQLTDAVDLSEEG